MYHYISSDMYFRVITRCNAMVLIISDIPNFLISAIIDYSFKRGEQIICIHIVKRQNLCHVDQGKFILKINSKVSIKKSCPIGCAFWSNNWVFFVCPSQSPVIVTIEKIVFIPPRFRINIFDCKVSVDYLKIISWGELSKSKVLSSRSFTLLKVPLFSIQANNLP